MRYYLIACDIFLREIAPDLALSPHVFEVQFLRKGLHEDPANLRQILQEAVDQVEESEFEFDGILLAYALCGKAIHGLRARSVPLVVPRAHDCITLFLGSRQEYQREFSDHPGTYYYTAGAIERGGSAGTDEHQSAKKYQEYLEKYGEENAKYLMEVEQGWLQHYTHAAYIRHKPLDFLGYDRVTKETAQKKGLEYRELPADLNLLQRMLAGQWDSEDFLVVAPGEEVTATNDEKIMQSVPYSSI